MLYLRRLLAYCFLYFPSLLWIGALIWFEGIYNFCLVGLCALFHECGHLLMFSLLKLPPPKPVPVARGVRLATSAFLSYREELLIALAGPLVNLGVCLIALPFSSVPWLWAFGEMSMLTALGNLLPVGELDGDRILYCYLSQKGRGEVAERVRHWLGFFTLCFVLLGSLLLLWVGISAAYPAFLALGGLLTQKMPTEQKMSI